MIFGVIGAAILLFRKKKDPGSVGRITHMDQRGETHNLTIKAAIEFISTTDHDFDLNQGEIERYDGRITISKDLQDATDLPEELTTKTHIRKALSKARKNDKALLTLIFYDNTKNTAKRKTVLDRAKELIDLNNGLSKQQDAYVYALIYIAEGGKYRWGDKGVSRGLKSEIIASGGTGKSDRVWWNKILSEKDGIAPERQAELIRSYDADDYYLREGIIQAILEVNTRKLAVDRLRVILEDESGFDFGGSTIAPF